MEITLPKRLNPLPMTIRFRNKSTRSYSERESPWTGREGNSERVERRIGRQERKSWGREREGDGEGERGRETERRIEEELEE